MTDRPTNLPLALTSLIGREQELAQLEPLVLTSRLLTLTGSGGAGKTRLALELARRVAGEFEGGAWLVELAPLTDETLVPAAIAQALGLVDRGGPLVDTLATFLEAHELLLVLDNCEHLIVACAHFVEQLLARCCLDLRILATSREPLGVPGEVAWRVPSLSLPPIESPLVDLSAVAQSEAARLFVERAHAALPGFTLQPGNAHPIAQICRRLDGMPLAIELAAARVGVLTVEQIAERLDDRFNLLRTNIRSAPARQQTLAAAIDWSHALLSPEEQILLRRLSVFAGGANLAAVEAICADASVGRDAILDIVSHLVDKSLVLSVVSDRGHETRYHLLETIRQYAGERLRTAGEAGTFRERHLAYYTRFAEQAEPELYRANAVAWLDRLDMEHDNFREALGWAINQAEHPADAATGIQLARHALQLAGVLKSFWHFRSHHGEGRAWFQKVLGLRLAQQPSLERARALTGAAEFAWQLNDMAAGRASADEGIAIAQGFGPAGRQILTDALRVAGIVRGSLGQHAAARPLLEQCLALRREINDSLGVAYALALLGAIMPRADIEAAHHLLDSSLSLFRAHGDDWGASWALVFAARWSFYESDFVTARRHYEESLAGFEKLSFWPGVASSLSELGRVTRLEGDLDRAQAYYRDVLALSARFGWATTNETLQLGYLALARGDTQEAASLFRHAVTEYSEVDDHPGVCAGLTGLAEVSSLQGNPRRAAQLLGLVEATLERSGTEQYDYDRPDYGRALKAVRAALEPAVLAAAWAVGRTQEPLKAIAGILDEAAIEASRPPARPARASAGTPLRNAKARWGGLTTREREVAALVAQGKSNRQIAEDLVVSERTVDAHTSNILSKLEFTSRTQIATWAIRTGLSQPGVS